MVTAAEAVLRHSIPDSTDRSVLIVGAGLGARSIAAALMNLDVRHVAVFDPDVDRTERLVKQAMEKGASSDRIAAASDLDGLEGQIAVVDTLPSRASLSIWPRLRGKELLWVLGDDVSLRQEKVPTDRFIDRMALCVERTAAARQLFTGSTLPLSATETARLEVSNRPGL